ncbi:MAG: flavin reductase [Treponema sp.]|nr:flavin reductase [Treponema sp.]
MLETEDFKPVDLKKAYAMIKSPAVVATKGEKFYNLTPYGWIMPLDYDPVTKVIFSSDPDHQAVANIKRTGEFAVAIPLDPALPFIEQTGSVSNADVDKFDLFKIDAEKASVVDVMLPKDKISGWIEFKFIRSVPEGSVELIMGQAVAAYSR